jgi:hypothetical protein
MGPLMSIIMPSMIHTIRLQIIQKIVKVIAQAELYCVEFHFLASNYIDFVRIYYLSNPDGNLLQQVGT